MRTFNVLTLTRLSAADRAKIAAVDPAIRLTDAAGWFDGEYRETWPAFSATRYLAPGTTGTGTRDDRDRMLAEAEIILGSWPFPLDLRSRSPRLKWFHQRPAGASNLLKGDLWGSDVTVTTSRGLGNTLAIAEYAVAGILHVAKDFRRVPIERDAAAFDARAWRPWLLLDKTVCVVGAGGIGLEVGRLCAALGMRVVGTRRHRRPDEELPPGFSEIGGAEDLDRFLPDSDIVVVCCQWTPETNRLFNRDRFAAMKAGGIFVNVARGEIVDEDALADALEHNQLRGAVLDVYVGEFEHAPMARLWSDPRVLITPHISGASDRDLHGAIELFRDNLRAYIDGGVLQNIIDWERGY
ncbi:MAG TPA: D-2-hydroxyacid dehydrogenase [Acetobacteraceae bacterium]|jgi:phosphoglycerate dehydrogenase-like enzyme|nr:D-2-hydroxyacid dehydrogenase [Acetobacteraceae bacterium]